MIAHRIIRALAGVAVLAGISYVETLCVFHRAAMSEGEEFLRQRQWAAAEQSFQEALDVKGFSFSRKAAGGVRRARMDAAKEVYDAAMAEGREMLARGEWLVAADAFGRACAVDGYSHDKAALAGRKQARSKAAAEAYQLAMDTGRKLMDEERWDAAEAAFEKALSADGYGADKAAAAGRETARYNAVSTAYTAAMEQGLALLEQQQWDAAGKAFVEAAEIAVSKSDVVLPQGREQALKAVARVSYQKATTAGRMLLQEKNWEKAEAAFGEALAVAGYERDDVALVGQVLARDGAARELFEATMAKAQESLRGERWAEAEAAFEQALGVPTYARNTAALDGRETARDGVARVAYLDACQRGVALLEAGNWVEAEKVFSQARELRGHADKPEGRTGQALAAAEAALARAAAEKEAGEWPDVFAALSQTDAEVPTVESLVVLWPAAVPARLADVSERYSASLAEAGDKLVPRLTVRAFLNDQEVQGVSVLVLGDGSMSVKTPGTVDLEPEKRYFLHASHAQGSDRYLATAAYRTRQWGAAETRLELKQMTPLGVPAVSMRLEPVPAGTFRMGSDVGDGSERPSHDVNLTRGFWMARTETTNAQYQIFLKRSGYDGQRDADNNYLAHHQAWRKSASDAANCPVVAVSWCNAAAFCRWVSEREEMAGRLPAGYEYRLPTEAEWEYAARGGDRSRGHVFSGSNEPGDVAWHKGNSGGWFKANQTHEVGDRAPNELDLYDLSGNVTEWCQDAYASYAEAPETDPCVSAGIDAQRVCRGGSWDDDEYVCRVTRRRGESPSSTHNNLGFRVVLAPALASSGTRAGTRPSGAQAGAPAFGTQAGAGASGTIVSVNPEWGFVVIGLGKGAKPRPLAQMAVLRGTDHICDVRVRVVQGDHVVADIVGQGGVPAAGDSVSSTLGSAGNAAP